MKKTIILLALALTLLCFSCSRKEGQLTILTENYPPLSYVENGEVTVYGAEVVAAIQKELGTAVKPELLNWDDAYERALSEPNVVLFTMERTPEREGKFQFIGPLGENVSSFYALKDSKLELPDLEAARNVKSIACTSNWFTEQYLQEQGFQNLVSSSDPIKTIKMVLDKQADLAVFTDVTYPNLMQSAGASPDTLKPVLELLRTEYYIAISSQTDEKVVKKWRDAFDKISQDGTLKAIKEKWFPAK